MQEIVKTMMIRPITTVGKYIMLMGRTFARPERMHMFFKQYLNEMVQLGVNSIGIVLLISFFIGAVITIQIKLNIESPWMPRFVVGYTTREIMLLEFSSSIMCLILSGKVGSNIASEIGVSAYFGYTVEGGSIAVGKASTDSVVMSSVLILFSDLVLTQLLMG